MTATQLILVGDVGGTHVRFAMADPTSRECHQQKTLRCAHFDSLAHAIETYLSECAMPRPQHACLAVAAPVTGHAVVFTNSPWQFHMDRLQRSLGLKSLMVINDFTALACALPHLSTGDTKILGAASLQVDPHQPMAVLGPGTGLGVAALIPDPHSNRHIPLATQGGHIHFAPADAFEQALLAELRCRLGRVSAEDLLSGRGLCALHAGMIKLGDIHGKPAKTSEELTAAMAKGDLGAIRCIDRFCAILGSLAGDLALAYGARGGVFIGGGLVTHFLDRLMNADFRQRFDDKGAMRPYVAAIATRVITAKTPALTGAVAYWQAHYRA